MGWMSRTLSYPPAPTSDQVDDYHGTPIADPYRPFEDSDAPEARAWITAQNELTERVLGAVPARREIRERLAQLWDFPRVGSPWRRGDRWFGMRNTGLQDQDVLWVSDAPGAGGHGPARPEPARHRTARRRSPSVATSESGELIAYATSDAGSDWRTWRVRRVASGEDLPDRLDWSKFSSAAWTHDDAGFFYGRYPEPPAGAAYDAPNRDMELRYHRLGADPEDDRLVFSTARRARMGLRAVGDR